MLQDCTSAKFGYVFRIPYHFPHSLCKCMGRSLNVQIENVQWYGMLQILPIFITRDKHCFHPQGGSHSHSNHLLELYYLLPVP